MRTGSGVRGLGLIAAAAAAAVVLTAAGGCYSRVVGARGPGADQYNIEQRYQEDSRMDRWFWGEESRGGRNRSLLNERSVKK